MSKPIIKILAKCPTDDLTRKNYLVLSAGISASKSPIILYTEYSILLIFLKVILRNFRLQH